MPGSSKADRRALREASKARRSVRTGPYILPIDLTFGGHRPDAYQTPGGYIHGDRSVDGAFVGAVLVVSGVWLWPVCFQCRRVYGWRTNAQTPQKSAWQRPQ